MMAAPPVYKKQDVFESKGDTLTMGLQLTLFPGRTG